MDSDQQELLHKDFRKYELKIGDPIFANTIAFNGEIVSDLIDVGGGYIAFELLAGTQKEEMPLILVKGKLENVSELLKKHDIIAGVGFLKKMQDQFVIHSVRLDRVPTQEEVNNLS